MNDATLVDGLSELALNLRWSSGVDLWVNTPRRPWEACGTSGMKVLVNGGLNLSEADGWWAEAYTPEVGWAIGDGVEHGAEHDAADAEDLYQLLERNVIPAFYSRDQQGVPRAWVAKMRESVARLTPQFSASRAVREYTETYYPPAAEEYAGRCVDGGRGGVDVCDWQHEIAEHWGDLRFGRVKVESGGEGHRFAGGVHFGKLSPDSVSVESCANPSCRTPLERGRRLGEDSYRSTGEAPVDRPSGDYTARIIPGKAGASVPLEANKILWQR